MSFRQPVSNHRDSGQPLVMTDSGFDSTRSRTRSSASVAHGAPQFTKAPSVLKIDSIIETENDEDQTRPPSIQPSTAPSTPHHNAPPPLSSSSPSTPMASPQSNTKTPTKQNQLGGSSGQTTNSNRSASQPEQTTSLVYSLPTTSGFRRPNMGNSKQGGLTQSSLNTKSTLAGSSPNQTGASIEDGDDDDLPPGVEKPSPSKPDLQPKSSFFKRAFGRFSTVKQSTTTTSDQAPHITSPIIEESETPNGHGNHNETIGGKSPQSSHPNTKFNFHSPPPLTNSDQNDDIPPPPPLSSDDLESIDSTMKSGQNNATHTTQQTSAQNNAGSFHSLGSTPSKSPPPFRGSVKSDAGANVANRNQKPADDRPTLQPSRSHHGSIDVVRIARVYVDHDILAPEIAATLGTDNDVKPSGFVPNRRSTITNTPHHISMTGQVVKPQPLCLTCHFRPTGDDYYDRETILHSILAKLQLSTETTMLPDKPISFNTSPADAQPITIGSNDQGASNVAVGDQELLSLINSHAAEAEQAAAGNEENDSTVASYDEKPSLVPTPVKKPGFLSRQFSLAKMNLRGTKSEQEKPSEVATISEETSPSPSPSLFDSKPNVVLTPITRRRFDPNMFVLVPYNSSTGQSDLSSLSPSQLRSNLQGQSLGANANAAEGPEMLRRMSISKNGFILEYSLISLEQSRAEMTFTTEDGSYFDQQTPGRGDGEQSGAGKGQDRKFSSSVSRFGTTQIPKGSAQHTIHEESYESDHDEWKLPNQGSEEGNLPSPRNARANTTRKLTHPVPQFELPSASSSISSTTSSLPPPPPPLTSSSSSSNQGEESAQTITSTTSPPTTPDPEVKKDQERKEQELFVRITGADHDETNPLNPPYSTPTPTKPKPLIIQGSKLPSYVDDINHIVTDTPVLHLDLVKVNKIKRKLPRTLTFTPTHLYTTVTHKHDCYHEIVQQKLREGRHQTSGGGSSGNGSGANATSTATGTATGSTGPHWSDKHTGDSAKRAKPSPSISIDRDDGVVFASTPLSPTAVSTAQTPTASGVSHNPHNHNHNHHHIGHKRQQSGLNGTNGELFAFVNAQHLAHANANANTSNPANNVLPQQLQRNPSSGASTSPIPSAPSTPSTSPKPQPHVLHNGHNGHNGLKTTQEEDFDHVPPPLPLPSTGSLILAATSPTRPLSPDVIDPSGLDAALLSSGVGQDDPSITQGSLNPGITPYLYRNEAPNQCPRCGRELESTFMCPLGEVLYASVVHIHSIRLCYLTRSSQLYLTDNAPLVATFINMYLSLCRQKSLTSSFTDLNKIVATHRILSTGAVKFIAVKMNALEQGKESIDLYSAQKITINNVVLSPVNFSQLGKKMVLTQFIPHVINTQALARAYPVLHHYVLSKGKNESQLLGTDTNGFGTMANVGSVQSLEAGSLPNLLPSSLCTTSDLATTTTVAADAIFNMFITGGVSFATDPSLSGFETQDLGTSGTNSCMNSGTFTTTSSSQIYSPRGPHTNPNPSSSSPPTTALTGRESARGDSIDRGDSDDEGERTSAGAQSSSFQHHSLQFSANDLNYYLSASNSLVFSNTTLEFAVSAVKSPFLDSPEHQIHYNCDASSNLLVNTIREANTSIGYHHGPPGGNKLGSFYTNIRMDRSHVDKNNQLTPEILQYLSTPVPSTTIQPTITTATDSKETEHHQQLPPLSQTTLTSTSTSTTTSTSTAAATITGTGGSSNTALLLTANPLNTVSNPHPFTNIQTLPFLYLDSSHYSQLLGTTIAPAIWRLVVKVMLICTQPNVFKTVVNTIPLIHNNHHQIMLSWVKTYETYKLAYDKYYSEQILAKKDKAAKGQYDPVYNRNDAFVHNAVIGDQDFQSTTTSHSTTTSAMSSALSVPDDIFDLQDPNHIFNQQYLSKTVREQIAKIDKEGSVLLYRTKQLTSALSQYVQQQHYDELCQFSIAPYTTIDSYVETPDAYIKKPSLWQQLTEQMQLEREVFANSGPNGTLPVSTLLNPPSQPRLEEPDYDTMVTHATQHAIELIIAPPLTPLLDVYLSLKSHSKDHKLHQICLHYTTHKRRQSDYNIPIHLQSPDKWTTAISTMKQITTVYTAVERLQCLLTCCKYIYHTYRLLLYTRQLAYNLTKHHATFNFLQPQDCEGFGLELPSSPSSDGSSSPSSPSPSSPSATLALLPPGHHNHDEMALQLCQNYATTVTKISSPSDELKQRILDHPRKEYTSVRKNKPVIEADIDYGKYVVTNRIPTFKEIAQARHGILVRLCSTPAPAPLSLSDIGLPTTIQDKNNLHSPEAHKAYTDTIRKVDQLPGAILEFILHKDDIGPNSSLCADDFFPIFVYVVMNAKITKLETIKQYIGSMAPRVSLTGEVGYYFTVFEAVIEYIDTLGSMA